MSMDPKAIIVVKLRKAYSKSARGVFIDLDLSSTQRDDTNIIIHFIEHFYIL